MQVFDETLIDPSIWDRFRNIAVGRYLLQREHEFIERSLTKRAQKPGRILELACCTGRVSERLRAGGHQVIGVDLDPVVLALYHNRSKHTPLFRGDLLELPFEKGSFDCILAIQCISYFNPNDFFQECNRVLSPGGLLVLQAVNRRNYKRVIKQVIRARSNGFRPADTIHTEEWIQTLEAHRFVIQEIRGYNWMPFMPENARLSDSKLVDVAARVETALELHRFPSVSRWLLIAARKGSEA